MPFTPPLPADRVRALTAQFRPAVEPEPARSETPEETRKRKRAQLMHKRWLKKNPERAREYLRRKNLKYQKKK